MEINSSHLSFETIADLALGASTDAEAVLHSKTCPQCELLVARVSSFIEIMKKDTTEEVPQYAFTAALRAFDERQTKKQNEQTRREKFLAVLDFDSGRVTPNFGFRSASMPLSRQMMYILENGTLDLRITGATDSWTISGQVLGEIFNGRVELQGKINLATEFDSQSHFILSTIPNGNYQLRLYSKNNIVEIPDLVIA